MSGPELRSYTDRIRAHPETSNKAEALMEHKRRRASDLELEFDEANGVYRFGGRKITFSCDVHEFDYENFTETNDSISSEQSSMIIESETDE